MSDVSHDELRKKFEQFDANHDGSIDEDEFAALIVALGVKLSPEHLQTAFSAIDVNANGRIDFGEFRGWWSRR